MKRTYYYSDELNDDFAGTNIKQKDLPVDHAYFTKNPLRIFFGFILYRIILTPIVWLIQKIWTHQRIKNKKALKKYRKQGYFLYANHTSAMSDAFTPTLVAFPKKAYVISNPDALSLPILGKILQSLGVVSLPTDRHGMRNFHNAVLKHAEKKHCVMIYPEAHIWPYYTKIRPFKDVSFRYPAETGKPVFTYTTTYQKRLLGKRPKVTVYIDGPFFPDKNLSVKENQKRLRNLAYDAMTKRAEKYSVYEYCEYIKVANSADLNKYRVNEQPTPPVPNAGIEEEYLPTDVFNGEEPESATV